MNELRIVLLGLFVSLFTACGSGPIDDDDSSVSDDDDSGVSGDDDDSSVSDDDDSGVSGDDDDSSASDDDDDSASDDDSGVSGDDDDSSVSDDDDSGPVDDDDSSVSDDDDDSIGDDDDAAPVTFGCGSSLSCTVDADYCQTAYPGVRNSAPIRSCEDMPAPCAASPDCTCIVANVEFPADSCSSGPLGGDTVEVYYP